MGANVSNSSKFNNMFDDEIEIVPQQKYGWKPQIPDKRDHYKLFNSPYTRHKKIDLRDKCPAIYDQGNLGSCTANALAFIYEFDVNKQLLPDFMPSRLFIYYNERDMEGTVSTDSGANIRDGIKSINKQGVCNEKIWAYDINKFTEKPTKLCYDEAIKNITLSYKKINQDLNQFRSCLAQGYPILFGFTVYESFESNNVAKTGIVELPDNHEKILGGHAVAIVGYNDYKKQFIVRNSWGDSWGDKGYCYFPYDYLLDSDLASDFWMVTKVTDKNI